MQLALVQAAVVIVLATVTGAYVLARRERRDLHWLICALLAVVVVWAAGMGLRHVAGSERLQQLSLLGFFTGVVCLPPLWLAVAVRLTGSRRLLSPRAAFVVLGLPPLLGFAALLTNGVHGWMLRDTRVEVFKQGAAGYAGPLFWVQLAWSYGVILAGCGVYLRQAFRMIRRREPWRGLAVVVGALLPVGVSILRVFGWIPLDFTITPSAASVSIVLLMGVYWRHHLSEIVPVARQDVIENLPDAVVVTDPSGRTVDVNPAAEQLLGIPAEQLRGRPAFEMLTGLAADLDPVEVARSLAVMQAGTGPAFTHLRLRDGRYLEVTGSAVRGRDDALAGYYAVYRDRTEERNIERFLLQSQRLETVAGLAAGVAHEVNNPLAYVRANLNHVKALAEEAREASAPKPEELDELRLVVDECIDGVDRIARIVDGMLRFSHLEAGGPESIDVNEVVADAVRLAQLHETGPVAVEVEVGAPLPPVWGSAENLVQAVLNLLVNGKQAVGARDDARIRIATRVERSDVLVQVSDNGPGVPPELRERIFTPFFTTKGASEGSGLGLAISAEIARKHGGTLELDASPGHGASFRLRLPAHDASA